MSAALRLSAQVENATIVAIICDRADRYLSTGEGLLHACGEPAFEAPSSSCQHEVDPGAALGMHRFCRSPAVPFTKPFPSAAAFHPCHSMLAPCNLRSAGLYTAEAGKSDPQPCHLDDWRSGIARLVAYPRPHFVLFTADRDPQTGRPWCPDCARCLEPVRQQVQTTGGTLLEVEVRLEVVRICVSLLPDK